MHSKLKLTGKTLTFLDHLGDKVAIEADGDIHYVPCAYFLEFQDHFEPFSGGFQAHFWTRPRQYFYAKMINKPRNWTCSHDIYTCYIDIRGCYIVLARGYREFFGPFDDIFNFYFERITWA